MSRRHPSLLTRPEPSAARAPQTPESVRVLGVDLALTDYDATLDWMDDMIGARGQAYVAVAATHTVMASAEDPALRAAIDGATMTVPDGQPLVWAMNALGHDLSSRVYGPELMDRACARAAELGHRIYLYGGRNEGALYQLTLNLRRRHQGLKIVGGHCPPFRPLSDDERRHRQGDQPLPRGRRVGRDRRSQAGEVDGRDAPAPGGAAAHRGRRRVRLPRRPHPQAPTWIRDSGLEGLPPGHEPKRLGRRYLRYNPRFVWGFARQYVRHQRDATKATRARWPNHRAPNR